MIEERTLPPCVADAVADGGDPAVECPLSKVGATVVPLDPTTSARDLALILDAAPFRALITRPRGLMGEEGMLT